MTLLGPDIPRRRNNSWLGECTILRSVCGIPRSCTYFLLLGVKTKRGPCDGARHHHETKEVLGTVLQWVGH